MHGIQVLFVHGVPPMQVKQSAKYIL